MGETACAVVAEGLSKRFGKTPALRGIDLQVQRGSVGGLLGPNGAGKTTAVRILATLLQPDGGHAWVTGHNVVREARSVRQRIGLAGQYAAVDELLTGQANLEMLGRLYHLPAPAARRRADELLERFGLAHAARRLAKTYSGGMRRRLDLAASIVAAPPVLFLDEPTAGLDPHSRLSLWDLIGELVADGTTVLLTTQHMDEADRLADRITIIDAGRVIAAGTPAELKAAAGGEHIDIVVYDAARIADAATALKRSTGADPRVDPATRRLTVPAPAGSAALIDIVRELDAARVVVDDVALRRPTLDEVFLRLTGHAPADAAPDSRTVAAAPGT